MWLRFCPASHGTQSKPTVLPQPQTNFFKGFLYPRKQDEMSYTLKADLEIIIEECIECGTKFGMTQTLHTWKKENKKSFYCPNGHSMSYTKSEADRLREIIAQKDKSLEYFRAIEARRSEEMKAKLAAKKAKREAAKKK